MTTLYDQIRHERFLFCAWSKVRASGKRSPSEETRNAIERFSEREYRHLRRIQRQLRESRFRFAPGRGVPIEREGKDRPRPIVVQDVEERIVQRSILDVVFDVDVVQKAVDGPMSFGGLPGKRVRDAIKVAATLVSRGDARYYIRSDVEDFFSNIPRLRALDELQALLPDDSLGSILPEATAVELSNQEELGHLLDFFPDETTGVLQGNSLSALLGNLVLSPFDRATNDGPCHCLRYLDDFLVLGPDKETVWATFQGGLGVLRELGMSAYDPQKDAKADEGSAQAMFEFLGCEISRGFVRPSGAKRRRLIASIRERLEASKRMMNSEASASTRAYGRSLATTLQNISRSIQAWAEQYSFCNYGQLQRNMDEQIDELLADYIGLYGDRKDRVDPLARRRMLGVRLLQDAASEPILGGGDS